MNVEINVNIASDRFLHDFPGGGQFISTDTVSVGDITFPVGTIFILTPERQGVYITPNGIVKYIHNPTWIGYDMIRAHQLSNFKITVSGDIE